MTEKETSFEPDWLSPPGDTIADVLEERGWSQAEFAQRIGYTTNGQSTGMAAEQQASGVF